LHVSVGLARHLIRLGIEQLVRDFNLAQLSYLERTVTTVRLTDDEVSLEIDYLSQAHELLTPFTENRNNL